MSKGDGKPCQCGSGLPQSSEYDGHGIFLFYSCERCYEGKIKKYRLDIYEPYEADEPIESDEIEDIAETVAREIIRNASKKHLDKYLELRQDRPPGKFPVYDAIRRLLLTKPKLQ